MNESAVSSACASRVFPAVVAAALLICPAVTVHAENVSLLSFGSSGLSVDTGFTTASYTQGTSALTFTAFNTGSATISLVGSLLPGPQDWSTYVVAPYTDFGLTIGIGGTNPDAAFSLTLFDGSSNMIATYGGATTGLTSPTPALITLTLDAVGSGNYGSVASLDLSWNDSMSPPNTVTVGSLVAIAPVPEPGAIAMALAGAACGGFSMWRRRQRA